MTILMPVRVQYLRSPALKPVTRLAARHVDGHTGLRLNGTNIVVTYGGLTESLTDAPSYGPLASLQEFLLATIQFLPRRCPWLVKTVCHRNRRRVVG